MAHLDRNDPIGVAEAIAAAGAPKAAEAYPRFARVLNTIHTELHGAQEDRLAFSQGRLERRPELVRRAANTKFKDEREAAEARLAEFDAYTKRRMSEFAERSAAATAKMETAGHCVIGCQEFISEKLGQGKRLRDVSLPPPAVLPAGVAATVEAKRAELVAIAERRADIANRPAVAKDLKAAISRAVAGEAEKGRPPFDPRIRGGRDPSKFAEQLRVRVYTGQFLTVGEGGVPFLVWLLADQIEARLHALVDEADLTGAMSDAEQVAAQAALDAERLAIEREEEALIRMAEAQGMAIARRADADPRAVLMVEVRE